MHAEPFSRAPSAGAQPPGFSPWIRRAHRWLAIAFTLPVVANFIAYGVGEPPLWLVYSPLPPLLLLMCSGLYLFARPLRDGGRAGRDS